MNDISIVISLIALVVAVFALLFSLKAKNKASSSRIRYYAKEEFESHFGGFTENKVREYIEIELSRREQKQKESTSVASYKDTAVAPANVTADQQKAPKEGTEDKGNPPVEDAERTGEITLPAPISIYVGSYKTGAFKYSSPTQDEKTIYCIIADDKDAMEGIINIDPSAYDKVAETPDYLEGACIVSGNGTQVKVCNPGKVIKENGQWVVKDSIEVELV